MGLAQPQEGVRVVRKARRADTGDRKKMKQRSFAQRKLFHDIGKGLGRFRPMLTKLNQDGFDLSGVK